MINKLAEGHLYIVCASQEYTSNETNYRSLTVDVQTCVMLDSYGKVNNLNALTQT